MLTKRDGMIRKLSLADNVQKRALYFAAGATSRTAGLGTSNAWPVGSSRPDR